MGLHRIQVRSVSDDCLKTECIIDGHEVPCVKSATFSTCAGEVPEFKFETAGIPDIDTMGCVIFDISPENLRDACFIVSEELKKHGDFYEAFVASVGSVLKDGITWSTDNLMDKKAEEIVNRIFGEG